MPAPGGWQETAIGGALAFAGTLAAVALGIARDAGSAFLLTLLLFLAFLAGGLATRRATARYYRDVVAMTEASSDFPRQRHRVRLDAVGITVEGPDGEDAASVARWHWGDLTEAEEG